ncbi:MAG: hypothetical protein ACYCZ7_02140 [Minisyncoccota bacterium]
MTPPTKTLMMNIATGLLVLGVITLAYFMLIKKSPRTTSTTNPGTSALALEVAQTIAVSGDISRTKIELSELKKAVASSIEVFNSREFKSLEDFSVEVSEEPIGRDNPFVPTDWKLKIKTQETAGKKTSSGGGSVTRI